MADSLTRISMLSAIAGVAALVGAIAWISCIGGPHGPSAGLISVTYMLISAGPPVLAYMLGAVGLGAIFRRWTDGAKCQASIEAGLGLSLMLSLSHGLGVLGLLKGYFGVILGGGAVLVGIILLARRIFAHVRKSGGVVTGSLPWPVLLGIPALALLLVASSNSPGWLWDSEHRGYDALSYHLQLPQEWIEAGRIWPADHNVYSYLPGYVESAFSHIAAMTGLPDAGRERSLPIGLLAGEGLGLVTCQLLHASMAILAAFLVGRLAAARCGREIGALTGAMFLSIPWVIVTGSLAYNEMGVAALFAAALIAAGNEGLKASRRGLLCGLLVGVACGCKPTAIFMCAPIVGLVLISRKGAREAEKAGTRAAVAVGWAMIGGLIAIAPWLVRNWSAAGNPVFPMATGLFGAGHWSAEQVQRYSGGHHFDGSLLDRVRVLFSDDRGLLHPQWSLLPLIAIIAWGVAMVRRHTRPDAIVFGLGTITQIGAWLAFTHLQSRFLLPLAVTGCFVVALGLKATRKVEVSGFLGKRARTDAAAFGAGALICIGLAGMAIGIFKGQSGGQPNLPLLQSPWYRSGELDRRVLAQAPERARELAESASPEIFVNVLAPPGTKVYLLGEARALYYTTPLLYNTTWDKWPLGEAMRRSPGKPAAWTRELWERGVRLVLVNAAEIDRLQKAGWADPLVTNEATNAWLQEEGRIVRSWPEAGVYLFELKPPGASR